MTTGGSRVASVSRRTWRQAHFSGRSARLAQCLPDDNRVDRTRHICRTAAPEGTPTFIRRGSARECVESAVVDHLARPLVGGDGRRERRAPCLSGAGTADGALARFAYSA